MKNSRAHKLLQACISHAWITAISHHMSRAVQYMIYLVLGVLIPSLEFYICFNLHHIDTMVANISSDPFLWVFEPTHYGA